MKSTTGRTFNIYFFHFYLNTYDLIVYLSVCSMIVAHKFENYKLIICVLQEVQRNYRDTWRIFESQSKTCPCYFFGKKVNPKHKWWVQDSLYWVAMTKYSIRTYSLFFSFKFAPFLIKASITCFLFGKGEPAVQCYNIKINKHKCNWRFIVQKFNNSGSNVLLILMKCQ